jgi:prophage DNA circulation protein
MDGIRSASLLLFLTILSACSSKSSSDELAKELQTVKSWTATAHLVGDTWMRGDVPTSYAKQTLSKTQEELQNEIDILSQKALAQNRTTLVVQLQRLQGTVQQMSKALEHKDARAMQRQIQQLSAQEESISNLAKTAGLHL